MIYQEFINIINPTTIPVFILNTDGQYYYNLWILGNRRKPGKIKLKQNTLLTYGDIQDNNLISFKRLKSNGEPNLITKEYFLIPPEDVSFTYYLISCGKNWTSVK